MNSIDRKIILHIDVDSFFVSCEVALRPELIGKEVAISIDNPNSIITSLSYEAKAKGAKVLQKLFMVRKVCKDLIIINPNMRLYQYYSQKIYNLLIEQYMKDVQIVSIDEWYLDVTKLWRKYGSLKKLALDIQNNIQKKLSIPISIGISYNKFLAKMATAINKPKGITVITPYNYQEMIWSMPITSYYGIGRKTSAKLIALNILTIGDLAKCNPEDTKIKKIFLNQSERIIANANGLGDDKLNCKNNILNSVGNETTFVNGFTENSNEIYMAIKKLCFKVSSRLIKRNLFGNCITVKLKLVNQSKSKSLNINKLINSEEEIYLYACRIFKNIWDDDLIIGIGITINKLQNTFQNKLDASLFLENRKISEAEKIVENINAKMHKKVVMLGNECPKYQKLKQNKYL